MHLHNHHTPSKAAGEYITSVLRVRAHQQKLVLLAGGSSLSILDYIDVQALDAHTTFIMGDERVSDEPKVNNFLQLTTTEFYKTALGYGVQFIRTVPDVAEDTPTSFAHVISRTLLEHITTHENVYILGIFGVGVDGHFASVFPRTPRKEFYDAFQSSDAYIDVHEPANPYPDRITITPDFIKTRIDEVLLYAIGSEKCDVLDRIAHENAKEHELPALIPSRHPQAHLFTDCEITKNVNR